MRLSSLFVPGALLLLTFSTLKAQQQDDLRFSPFDCREHSEENSATDGSGHTGLMETIPSETLIQVVAPEPVVTLGTVDAWKTWSYVENFAFGKDRGGMAMITDIEALHPFLRDRIFDMIAACRAKGIELAVVETYRTHAKQHEYKTMGKQYTNSGAGKSKHQYGLAIDVVPVIDNIAVWDNSALWKKVGAVGEKLGLRWGGRWKKPYDPGHFEWTGGLATSNLYNGAFPAVPNADVHYPCLEDDIQQLQKSWSEWELTQSSVSRK